MWVPSICSVPKAAPLALRGDKVDTVAAVEAAVAEPATGFMSGSVGAIWIRPSTRWTTASCPEGKGGLVGLGGLPLETAVPQAQQEHLRVRISKVVALSRESEHSLGTMVDNPAEL